MNWAVRLGLGQSLHLQLNDLAQDMYRALERHFINQCGSRSCKTDCPPDLTTILTYQAILLTKIP